MPDDPTLPHNIESLLHYWCGPAHSAAPNIARGIDPQGTLACGCRDDSCLALVRHPRSRIQCKTGLLVQFMPPRYHYFGFLPVPLTPFPRSIVSITSASATLGGGGGRVVGGVIDTSTFGKLNRRMRASSPIACVDLLLAFPTAASRNARSR